MINKSQPLIFSDSNTQIRPDIIHYLQTIPSTIPDTPFVIDIENAISLSNFMKATDKHKQEIINTLNNPQCNKIICLTHAAKRSIKSYFLQDYDYIKQKICTIYPAIPNYTYGCTGDTLRVSYTKDSKQFNILFVGPPIKGLIDLLEAIQLIRIDHPHIGIYIVSDIEESWREKYSHPNTHFLKPNFQKEDIITKLYLPADLFVLPTRRDTFGMAILDALSSGTPVITTDQYAAKELVDHKKDGLLIHAN